MLVAVRPRADDPIDLENALLTVRRTVVDAGIPDRVRGEILALDPAPRTLRARLPILARG